MKTLLRKLRAKLGGYFWLPCPVCGRKVMLWNGKFKIAFLGKPVVSSRERTTWRA